MIKILGVKIVYSVWSDEWCGEV